MWMRDEPDAPPRALTREDLVVTISADATAFTEALDELRQRAAVATLVEIPAGVERPPDGMIRMHQEGCHVGPHLGPCIALQTDQMGFDVGVSYGWNAGASSPFRNFADLWDGRIGNFGGGWSFQ